MSKVKIEKEHLISDLHLLWPELELHIVSSKEHLQMRVGLLILEICIC